MSVKLYNALKCLNCILAFYIFIWFIHIFGYLFDNLIVYFCLFALVLF